MRFSLWCGIALALFGLAVRADANLAAESQRAFFLSLLETNDKLANAVGSLNEGMTETREMAQALVHASHKNIEMPLQIAASEEKLMRYIDYKFEESDRNVMALRDTLGSFLAILSEITRTAALPPTKPTEELCVPVEESDE